jgi:hypothetical protein
MSPAATRAISHVSTWKIQAMAAARPALSLGGWGKSAGRFFMRSTFELRSARSYQR